LFLKANLVTFLHRVGALAQALGQWFATWGYDPQRGRG